MADTTESELEKTLREVDERLNRGLRARGFDPQQAANLALPAKLARLFSEREQLRNELEAIKRKNKAN